MLCCKLANLMSLRQVLIGNSGVPALQPAVTTHLLSLVSLDATVWMIPEGRLLRAGVPSRRHQALLDINPFRNVPS